MTGDSKGTKTSRKRGEKNRVVELWLRAAPALTALIGGIWAPKPN